MSARAWIGNHVRWTAGWTRHGVVRTGHQLARTGRVTRNHALWAGGWTRHAFVVAYGRTRAAGIGGLHRIRNRWRWAVGWTRHGLVWTWHRLIGLRHRALMLFGLRSRHRGTPEHPLQWFRRLPLVQPRLGRLSRRRLPPRRCVLPIRA